MKRDFDLVRRILSDVEGLPAGASGFTIHFDDVDQAVVDEHCEILIEAGLIDGKAMRGMQGLAAVHVRRLTWAGHDFLAAAADDTIWAKGKKLVVERGGAVTFDLLLAWLKKEAGDLIGLPVL